MLIPGARVCLRPIIMLLSLLILHEHVLVIAAKRVDICQVTTVLVNHVTVPLIIWAPCA